MRTIASFFSVVLLLTFCKSSQSNLTEVSEQQKVDHMLVLLANNVDPTDLEIIRSFNIKETKRVSRSQNQWMIKIDHLSDQDIKKLKEKLELESRVLKVSDVSNGTSMESNTNTKSGRTKPIKN